MVQEMKLEEALQVVEHVKQWEQGSQKHAKLDDKVINQALNVLSQGMVESIQQAIEKTDLAIAILEKLEKLSCQNEVKIGIRHVIELLDENA
jgi:protein-tyrosine phosphatase